MSSSELPSDDPSCTSSGMGRLARMVGWAIVLIAIAVLALAPGVSPRDPPLDSAPLIAALIAKGNVVTPLRAVVTDPPWDVVCLQHGYSRPSRVLRKHLEARAEDLVFQPCDIVTGEHERGLIFVNVASGTVHTFTFRIGYRTDTEIRGLDGPTCLGRDEAWYMIERVQGFSAPYNVLTLLSMD